MSRTPKNCEVPGRRRKGSVEARILLSEGIFEFVTQRWFQEVISWEDADIC
jgi:hypothetical protein